MIEWWEIEELACELLNWDYENYENGLIIYDLGEEFYNKFNIDLEDFSNLVKALIKFTPTWKSDLTGTLYQGFVVKENDEGLMRSIIKQEVK